MTDAAPVGDLSPGPWPWRLSQTVAPDEVELELFANSLQNAWLMVYFNLSIAFLLGVMQITSGEAITPALAGFVARCSASMIGSAILLPVAIWGRDWMARRRARCRAALVAPDAVILGATGLAALAYVSEGEYSQNAQLVVALGAAAAISAILAPRLPAALPLGRLLIFVPMGTWLTIQQPPGWGILLSLAVFSYVVSVAIAVWVYVQSLSAADVAVRLRAAHLETRALADRLSASLGTERENAARIKTEAQLRERFLHAVTHDLRQSLTALKLHSRAYAKSAPGPAAAARAQVLLDGLASADATIESVAQAAWLVDRGPSPEMQIVPLGRLLAAVCEQSRPLFDQADMELRLVDTRLAVRAAPNFLERTLRNLVHNALRHSRGQRVVIGARRRGTRVEIVVADNGRGIPEDVQDKIFDRFYQDGGPAGRPVGSVGLGLAIVKEMTERMGGTVGVQSRPGAGTVFSINLERADAPGHRPQGVPGRVVVMDDEPTSRAALVRTAEALGWCAVACDSPAAVRAVGRADAYLFDFFLSNRETALDALEDLPAQDLPRVLVVSSHLPQPLAARVRAKGPEVSSKPLSEARLADFLAGLPTSQEPVLAGQSDGLGPT